MNQINYYRDLFSNIIIGKKCTIVVKNIKEKLICNQRSFLVSALHTI